VCGIGCCEGKNTEQIRDVYMPCMQAEKILAMVAKEARAAGILAGPQLELVAAPTGDAALMTMHYWRLAHHHVNDSKDSLPPPS